MHTTPLDLPAIQRLSAAKGRGFWRSLEELAETDEFTDFLHREFPRQASEWLPNMSRRRFLQLMGASPALAVDGVQRTGKRRLCPTSTPEGSTAGQSLFFATAMPLGGYGCRWRKARCRPPHWKATPITRPAWAVRTPLPKPPF
ncbi:MAG: TAT-variant-translocated molybdopterin oxidoreductase [Caldilineaceae bacterium]